jgi:hypothetical protein
MNASKLMWEILEDESLSGAHLETIARCINERAARKTRAERIAALGGPASKLSLRQRLACWLIGA